MAYVFPQVSHLFFLICAQKEKTHCTYVRRHEDVKAQHDPHAIMAVKIVHTQAKHVT